MNIIISIIKLLGGLALLIYGMKVLSTNLKKLSGGKLEKFLASATDNAFKGLLTGILITVATQSSSATTIIVIGLVNSEILKLRNSIPIIMGANIGTTITSQILRLTSLNGTSILSLFTPAVLAPVFIFIGFIIMETAKKKSREDLGLLLLGIGLLFTGMMTMVDTASTFSNFPIISTMMAKLSNPILGLLAGTLITALLQSSAATIGILQALSTTGIVTYSSAIPIVLGQNIGTCVTSVLACIGGSKNAKRAATIHLYFNLIGTIIFLIIIYSYQYLVGFPFWQSNIDMGQIANFHTIFNVISTIILFPCIGLLEKLTMITIKDNGIEDDNESENYLSVLNTLDERVLNIPNIAITNCTTVIAKMGELSESNFRRSMNLIDKFENKRLKAIQAKEDAIDTLDAKLTEFLIKLGNLDLPIQENMTVTALLKIESEFEKVGDYAYKFSKTVESMHEKNIVLSPEAYDELKMIYNITEDSILTTLKTLENKENSNLIVEIKSLKEFAEIQKENFKNTHIERLKKGDCNIESGIAFLEILTICEKIIGHCSNICVSISSCI